MGVGKIPSTAKRSEGPEVPSAAPAVGFWPGASEQVYCMCVCVCVCMRASTYCALDTELVSKAQQNRTELPSLGLQLASVSVPATSTVTRTHTNRNSQEASRPRRTLCRACPECTYRETAEWTYRETAPQLSTRPLAPPALPARLRLVWGGPERDTFWAQNYVLVATRSLTGRSARGQVNQNPGCALRVQHLAGMKRNMGNARLFFAWLPHGRGSSSRGSLIVL